MVKAAARVTAHVHQAGLYQMLQGSDTLRGRQPGMCTDLFGTEALPLSEWERGQHTPFRITKENLAGIDTGYIVRC